MRVVVVGGRDSDLAGGEERTVVEVAVVGRDSGIAAAILGSGILFSRQECFIELFAVSGADDLDSGPRPGKILFIARARTSMVAPGAF